MFITNLFRISRKCTHEHVTPDRECGYCPDCGKFIKNEWYITRCACCGVKLRAMIKNGEVVPQHKFCANCGSEEFIVEKLDQINFIDINYKKKKKQVVEDSAKICSTTRCWQERTDGQPKLLVQYL